MTTEQVIVQCEIPFLFRTDDPETDDFEFFEIPNEDYTARLGFRMSPGGGKGGVVTAGGADEDRLGHMSTTHILAEFNTDFIESIPSDVHELDDSLTFQMGSGAGGKQEYIVEELTSCVNKFIEIYRVETESYWMRKLLPHDIFDFHIVEIDQDGDESEMHYKYTASPMTGMGSTLPDQMVEEIKEKLNNSTRASIFSRLQLEIRDAISLEEYDIAVVDSQRLMEYWIKEAFECLLISIEGHSQSSAESIARHDNGEFKDFHDIRGMYQSNLSFDIEATQEFQDWEDNAKPLRNDIIHEGYEPTKSEAVETAQINNDLIMRVKSEFGSNLNESLSSVTELPDDGVGRTTMGEE